MDVQCDRQALTLPGPCLPDTDAPRRHSFTDAEALRYELYVTPTPVIERFADNEIRSIVPLSSVIWEPCCGTGAIADVLVRQGYTVIATDLHTQAVPRDFLTWSPNAFDVIVTNPPYARKADFIRRACELGKPWIMLLPYESLGSTDRASIWSARHDIMTWIESGQVAFQCGTRTVTPSRVMVWIACGFNKTHTRVLPPVN